VRSRAPRSVPPLGRVLDAVGALLFASGGVLYARSWAGFRRVQEYQPKLGDGEWAAIRLADEYWRLQRIGTALMLVGLAVFVGAWWVAGRAGNQEAAPPSEATEG
jgi:hypothetical protein